MVSGTPFKRSQQHLFTAILFTQFLFSTFCNAQTSAAITKGGTTKSTVQFYSGNWAALLTEAQKTGKPFFVDFYTDWCGPCKLMTRNTFGNAQVGGYANQHFIAYKLNAEQGEGESLAARYRIEGYPTVVFYGSNGLELGRWVGYADAEEFLRVLTKYQAMSLNTKQRGDAGPKSMKRISPESRSSLRALFE